MTNSRRSDRETSTEEAVIFASKNQDRNCEQRLHIESTIVGSPTEAVQPLRGSDTEEGSVTDLPKPPEEAFSWKFIAAKVTFSVCTFLLLTLLLERFAGDKVTAASEKLMQVIGLPGLFLAVFVADGLPQPFTYVPLIFLAVKGSVQKPVVLVTCAAASYTAALAGYCIGTGLRVGRIQCVEDRLKEMMAPSVHDLMVRKGALGVAFAALLPVPLALATWTAGFLAVEFHQFLPAPLARIPKIVLFVLLSRAPQAEVSAAMEDVVVEQ